MPLLSLRKLPRATLLGIWQVSESEAELISQFPHLAALPIDGLSTLHHATRRMERLVAHVLIHRLTGHSDWLIRHDDEGRPSVPQGHVSVSHTRGYVAVIWSEQAAVAVDIEQRGPKVMRVADRFVRPDESTTTLQELLLLWSAKETVYKLYPFDHLQYQQMRLAASSERLMVMENMVRKEQVEVCYEANPDHVLTYAVIR